MTRNSGSEGGGIGSAGTRRLTGSTVSGNSSKGVNSGDGCGQSGGVFTAASGGGILNRGSLTLRDSTVTANTATDRGGDIFNRASGTVTMRGSASVTGNTPDDCAGTPACQWNEGSGPFTWVRTADEILAKAVRKPRATSESAH